MKELRNLIEKFAANRSSYTAASYKEARVRKEFIDPLFQLLGWDMHNEQGLSEVYKEVIHEDSIQIGEGTKAPDYAFRVGGMRKFFVEAKKPSIDVKDDPAPAYQLRRYAWSSGLALSILTDFEEFAVYDCLVRPNPGDKARTARVMYVAFADLEKKWKEISELFSKEAVESGALDNFAQTARKKKGTETVDDAFLGEIEGWRAKIAKALARSNPALSNRDLNFAVQLTIDRIIFLRIAEDRGIEPYRHLDQAAQSEDVYGALLTLFQRADDKYNSGLFHFKKEKGRTSEPDQLTPSLKLNNGPLRPILAHLYPPKSPYEFSVLPTQILGQVYEQFLGKTIRVLKDRKVKVEEKPELRKAGGIYYTPGYIVNYIVERALSPSVDGKTPRQVANLRIVDPACGSGSFLISAYQFLLDWHRNWYAENDPGRHSKGRHPRVFKAARDDWRLTTAERKRILLANIFGVDVDPQAVEVSKLSLLLKVLEGESRETIGENLKLFQERALPDLSDNVKCGNSLIGPDFFRGKQLAYLDEDDVYRINPFDWHSEFDQVFGRRNPGFDVVIGNPPYRRELDYKYLLDEIAETDFGRRYRSARMDLWYYFVHRGLELLRPSGVISFIVNSYWTSGTGAEKLIEALSSTAHLEEVFSLGKLKVFRNVSGQHMIFRAKQGASKAVTRIRAVPPSVQTSAEPFVVGQRSVEEYDKEQDQLFHDGKVDLQRSAAQLLKKIERGVPLKKMGRVRQGIAENPPAINKKTNEKFGERWTVGDGVFALTDGELAELKLPASENKLVREYHDLCDLDRFYVADKPSLNLIYSTKTTAPNLGSFPRIKKHLERYRPIMEERRETKKGSNRWWHLHWPRDEDLFVKPKVLSIQMADRPSFAFSESPVYVSFSVNVFVPAEDVTEDIAYVAALLNSRLLWKWYQHNAKRRGAGLEINGNVLSRSPIRRIDFSKPGEAKTHDRIVELARDMQDIAEKLRTNVRGQQRSVLKRRMAAANDEIDGLVFDLYGLTQEEVEEVREATKES